MGKIYTVWNKQGYRETFSINKGTKEVKEYIELYNNQYEYFDLETFLIEELNCEVEFLKVEYIEI